MRDLSLQTVMDLMYNTDLLTVLKLAWNTSHHSRGKKKETEPAIRLTFVEVAHAEQARHRQQVKI